MDFNFLITQERAMKTLILTLVLSISFSFLSYSQRNPNTGRDNTGERTEKPKNVNPVRNPDLKRQEVKSPERIKPPVTTTPPPTSPPHGSPDPIDHHPIERPPYCPIREPVMPTIEDDPVIIVEPVIIQPTLNNLSPAELYELGVNRLNNELYSQSIDCFDILLQIDPLDSEVYCLRGRAYYGLELYDRAKKDFKVSLKIDSTYAESYYYLGITELQLGNKLEAEDNFELASAYGYEKADIILKRYFSN
jgi:hypothetical protein